MGRAVLQPHGTGMALEFISDHLKTLNFKYCLQALSDEMDVLYKVGL